MRVLQFLSSAINVVKQRYFDSQTPRLQALGSPEQLGGALYGTSDVFLVRKWYVLTQRKQTTLEWFDYLWCS